MPTVPPTCVSLSSLADEGLVVPSVSSAQIHLLDEHSGPTPDPEMDDVVLVPAETGNAVTVTHPAQLSAATSPCKPRLSLSNLELHSPSCIVGTPFDLSPRFEYPFPTLDEQQMPASASLPNLISSPAAASFGLQLGSAIAPLPLLYPRADTRGYSPTHPKLHPREPPMPPGLAKKRQLVREVVVRPGKRETLPLHLQDATVTGSRRSSLEHRASDETVVSDGSADSKEGARLESKVIPESSRVNEGVMSVKSEEGLFISDPTSSLKSSSEVTLVLHEDPMALLDSLEGSCPTVVPSITVMPTFAVRATELASAPLSIITSSADPNAPSGLTSSQSSPGPPTISSSDKLVPSATPVPTDMATPGVVYAVQESS